MPALNSSVQSIRGTVLAAGAVVRDRAARKPFWLHQVLAIAILLAFLQSWWEAWSLRSLHEWTFPTLLAMIAPDAVLFLVAHLLFPSDSFEGSVEDYYFSQAPVIFGLVGASAALSALFRFVILQAVVWPEVAAALAVVLGCLALSVSTHRFVHCALVPLGLLLSLWDALEFGYSLAEGAA